MTHEFSPTNNTHTPENTSEPYDVWFDLPAKTSESRYDLPELGPVDMKALIHDFIAERAARQNAEAERDSLLTEIEQLRRENAELAMTANTLTKHNKRLGSEAYTDQLTGLANRRGFFREATDTIEALEDETSVAVIAIDMSRFKQINDHPGWGHDIGDGALKIAADVLRDLVRRESIAQDGSARPADVIGRLGGDEFAILMPLTGEGDTLDKDTLQELVDQITADKVDSVMKAVRETINDTPPDYPGIARLDEPNRELLRRSIGMTVGAVTVRAEDVRTPEALGSQLQRADSVLYEGKRQRRPVEPLAALVQQH